MRSITDAEIEQWLEDGFVVIPDFLSADEVAEGCENALRYQPTWEDYAQHAERYRRLTEPGVGIVSNEFPFAGDALNRVTTADEILDLAERTIGTDSPFLTQSILWGKYAGSADYEQELHCDFGNNSLLFPRDEDGFRQLPMIVYYTDVTEEHGPTHVLPQKWTRDRPLYPAVIRRTQEPELYEHEQAVTVRAGSLMIYSMRTFHRGSAFRAKEGARFTQHIVYRAAGYEWMGFRSWPRHGNEPAMQRVVEQASVRQRNALGIPGPGHPYWNEETLSGVAARYPGMDISPYRAGAVGVGAASEPR